MRILLIDDEPATARGIKLALGPEDFDVHTAELGEQGIDLGKRNDYDAIILDLQLPDMNGLDVLRTLRAAKVNTPVLMLSGDATVEARVKSLDIGADDYVTKPYHKDELAARVCAIVRRSRVHEQSFITVGRVVVNLDMKTVEAAGAKVPLTIKEYQLLECLLLKKGTTLTKFALLTYLYSGMDEPPEKIIDVFVCKLRKKLTQSAGGENYIETVWGRGYVLRDPPSAEGAKAPQAAAAAKTA